MQLRPGPTLPRSPAASACGRRRRPVRAHRGARPRTRSSGPDGRSRRPPYATAAACRRGIQPRRRRRRRPVRRGSPRRPDPRPGCGSAAGQAATSPRRPGGGSLKIEHHRREQLNPVSDKLAVGRLAHLAGPAVKAEAPGPGARHPRGLHAGSTSADRGERLGDSTRHELVVARRLRTLAPLDTPLAVLTGVMPPLLAGQKLGQDVRLPLARRALVALAPMPRPAVAAIELDPRPRMLWSRAPHPRCAHPRHPPRLASQSDGSAQRDARGGGRPNRET
jgi:hypothetical protein